MSRLHLKPIGIRSNATKRVAPRRSPSLSCDYNYFSYPIAPDTPKLDATTSSGDQKRVAA